MTYYNKYHGLGY